jgi:hypothetical protein
MRFQKLQLLFLLFPYLLMSQEIAVLKYNGGGDWYANPTSLTNLIAFCNSTINTTLKTTYNTVEVGSTELYQYPFIHMTGHGNVYFSDEEAENLRTYLTSGGFLHIDDNYGMDIYIRKELHKVFPNQELTELPTTHPIFNSAYLFPKGLPKIHEHDNKRPQAFGFFHEGRLICLYTTEADLGDGWENSEIHNDPEDVRKKALQMGANIIKYVFNN